MPPAAPIVHNRRVRRGGSARALPPIIGGCRAMIQLLGQQPPMKSSSQTRHSEAACQRLWGERCTREHSGFLTGSKAQKEAALLIQRTRWRRGLQKMTIAQNRRLRLGPWTRGLACLGPCATYRTSKLSAPQLSSVSTRPARPAAAQITESFQETSHRGRSCRSGEVNRLLPASLLPRNKLPGPHLQTTARSSAWGIQEMGGLACSGELEVRSMQCYQRCKRKLLKRRRPETTSIIRSHTRKRWAA